MNPKVEHVYVHDDVVYDVLDDDYYYFEKSNKIEEKRKVFN